MTSNRNIILKHKQFPYNQKLYNLTTILCECKCFVFLITYSYLVVIIMKTKQWHFRTQNIPKWIILYYIYMLCCIQFNWIKEFHMSLMYGLIFIIWQQWGDCYEWWYWKLWTTKMAACYVFNVSLVYLFSLSVKRHQNDW